MNARNLSAGVLAVVDWGKSDPAKMKAFADRFRRHECRLSLKVDAAFDDARKAKVK
jgi:hypothetical protein